MSIVVDLFFHRLFLNQGGVSLQISFGARTFQLFLKLRLASQTNGKLLCLKCEFTEIWKGQFEL